MSADCGGDWLCEQTGNLRAGFWFVQPANQHRRRHQKGHSRHQSDTIAFTDVSQNMDPVSNAVAPDYSKNSRCYLNFAK